MSYDSYGMIVTHTTHPLHSFIFYAFSKMVRAPKRSRAEESSHSAEDDDNEIPNYYKTLPKKFQHKERTYPSHNKVQIDIPFRMVVTGTTGSGKTNAVLAIIKRINAFSKIMIFSKLLEEPLYADFIESIQDVEKKTGQTILTTSNTLADLPPTESLPDNPDFNTLLLIDDMIKEEPKMLDKVTKYWIFGRKKEVSSIFITQSFFSTPLQIRQNTQYWIFTKLENDQDFKRIIKEFGGLRGVTAEQLVQMFELATAKGFPNFFMIDRDHPGTPLQFRHNFKPIAIPERKALVPSGIGRPPVGAIGEAQKKEKLNEQEKSALQHYGELFKEKEKKELEVAEPHITSETKITNKGKLKKYVDSRMEIDDSGEPMSLSDWRWELGVDEDNKMQEGDGVKKRKRRKTSTKTSRKTTKKRVPKKASSPKIQKSAGKLLSDAQLLSLIRKPVTP